MHLVPNFSVQVKLLGRNVMCMISSLTSNQRKTGQIITVTMFRSAFLMRFFFKFYFQFSQLVLASTVNVYQTLETAFCHIF